MDGKINEDFILILKLEKNNKLLELDYLPIENLFEEEFKDFVKEINSKTPINETLENFIQFNSFLLEEFSYTEDISSRYNQIREYLNAARLEKLLLGEKNEIIELIEALILRINAFRIEKSYESANSLIDDGQALAFSHRKVGWTAKPFELSRKFKIQFNTNFGYGHVSYFYLVIEYKKIKIIPYSDWIDYKDAKMHEIQRYTRKYIVEDESWLKAMETCIELYNLSLTNEKEFVDKFIIHEAEKMVDGLKEIMKYPGFKLLSLNHGNAAWKKEGYGIIEYRVEKISGALQFITHLMNFNDYDEIKQAIKDIKNINLELLPIIKRENELITKRIKEIEPKFLELKPLVDNLRLETRDIMARTNEILDILRKENEKKGSKQKPLADLVIERNKLQLKEMPDWEEKVKRYHHLHNVIFNPLNQELKELQPFSEKISNNILEIENYFSKN